VTGDVTSAKISGAGVSFSPGSVPAGIYIVTVTMSDGTSSVVRNVVVSEGGTVTIQCKIAFGGCKKM
jgi:hypothetical protein